MPRRTYSSKRRTRRTQRAFTGRRNAKKTSPGTSALDTIRRHGPSLLKFAYSFFCKQPMPDRYMTWLHYDNYGRWASGIASGSAGFCINWPVFPLNNVGGTGTALPNPANAIATSEPGGLKNMLNNSGTGTGIYDRVRVWTIRVEFTLMPQAAGDTVVAVNAPVAGNTNFYSNTVLAGQGVNSVSKMCEFSVAAKANTLMQVWNMPQLAGIKPSIYAADTDYEASYTTGPSIPYFCQVNWSTADASNLVSPLTWRLRTAYHCEFFGRTDVGLLDT